MVNIKPGSVLGIIGGGQLGKMTAQAAAAMGIKVHILSDKKNCPAKQVSDKVIVSDFTDDEILEKFAKSVDVVTFEFENIPYDAVNKISKIVEVRPNPECLKIAQNRIREKGFLNSIGIKTAPYEEVTSANKLKDAYAKLKGKCILKTAEMGYDGKGQQIVDKNSNLDGLWKDFSVKQAVLEKMIDFEREISVLVSRSSNGGAMPYMPVENRHVDGILDTTIAPAQIDTEIIDEAWDIAFNIADAMDLVGVLAVEMFVTKDGQILVNELAPRPHNSGHWTLDACMTSQFEQLVRAVCDFPLGSTDYHSKAVMKNLIGEDINLWNEFMNDPDTKIHIYGKADIREGRKMGHVTHLLSPDDELLEA